jgi:hypothetical protein
LFGEYVRIHWFDCSLVLTFRNKAQVPSTITHSHLCHIALEVSKPKPFSAVCAHRWVFSESIMHKTCDNLVENSE